MNLKLTGKKVLVTGSSAGIGEGIIRILAREGATVVVHGRDEVRTSKVAATINEEDGKAFAVTGDLGTDEGAEKVANDALTALGGVDI